MGTMFPSKVLSVFIAVLFAAALLLALFAPPAAATDRAWGDTGVKVTQSADVQNNPVVTSDGTGGAFVAWYQQTAGSKPLYAQYLDASGTPQWGANGMQAVNTISYQTGQQVTSDGAGGAILVWVDGRVSPSQLYAQRLGPDGNRMWGELGVQVATSPVYPYSFTIAPDGSGGVRVAWDIYNGGVYNVYAQRLGSSGAQQWGASGVKVSNASSLNPTFPQITPNGGVVWQNCGGGSYNVWAQKLDLNGTKLWGATDVQVNNASTPVFPNPSMVQDDWGDYFITWETTTGTAYNAYAQKLGYNGVKQWGASGVKVNAAASNQWTAPRIAPDDDGGAFVAWQRADASDDYYPRMQLLGSNGLPQWPADSPLSDLVSGNDLNMSVTHEWTGGLGSGLFSVAFEREESGSTAVLAQQVDVAGRLQWGASGALVSTVPEDQVDSSITTDGRGGALIAFNTISGAVYAQRLLPVGGAVTWYLAEGCTEGGMETWVLVQNPGAADVTVDFTLQTSSGEQKPAGLQGRVVPPGSRMSFNLGAYWTDWNVSTRVDADGNVVCERAMYGSDRQWAHESIGATAPSAAWYLAEGCTEGGMETWVLVQNPGTSDVTVNLDLMTSSGEQKPAGLQDQTVPAGSRRSFNLGEYYKDWNVSTHVTASGEVICERAMYGNDRQWAHDSVGATGATTTWYLAEGCTEGGMETWVLVQNVKPSEATVDLTLMTSTGEQKPAGLQGQVVPGNSRRSFNIGEYCTDWNVSTMVEATEYVVCERAMYGSDRTWAHDSVGVTSPSAAWYLAEGCTEGGMETWVLVQNPGTSDVNVDLTLMTSSGRQSPAGLQNQTVPAGSRRSFNLGEYWVDWNVSTRVQAAGGNVICERAMYGSDRTWAHDSIGFH